LREVGEIKGGDGYIYEPPPPIYKKIQDTFEIKIKDIFEIKILDNFE